jgi:hypothetical protein
MNLVPFSDGFFLWCSLAAAAAAADANYHSDCRINKNIRNEYIVPQKQMSKNVFMLLLLLIMVIKSVGSLYVISLFLR